MAIEKTVFSNYTINEVGAWLIDNAADYFDEIAMNGSTIECKIGEQVVLSISYNISGSGSSRIYRTDISIIPVGSETAVTRCFWNISGVSTGNIKTAYKTSKGIFLACMSTGSVFICKNTDGDTCVITIANVSTSIGNSGLRSIEVWDIENTTQAYDITPYKYTSQSASGPIVFGGIYNSAIMSILPVATSAGSVIPGIYMALMSPYVGDFVISGKIVQLGASDKYAFSGVIALGE
ncbi:MAG: hypothetical protein IKO27_02005 [Ruminococcus sp.]|nr:hypothetical protein [Ruminococcus sp.]